MSASDSEGAPPPVVLDLSDYTPVTIVKTDEVDGFVYRRGSRHNVDAATLSALRDKGMLADDAKAAG